jgi:hypothetical protein
VAAPDPQELLDDLPNGYSRTKRTTIGPDGAVTVEQRSIQEIRQAEEILEDKLAEQAGTKRNRVFYFAVSKGVL